MTAIGIAHWPGKDTPVCLDHLKKIVSIGSAMGFRVSVTPLPEDTEITCTNCDNEAKKREGKS